jgi:DUF4097 and DUF4098 domain-containing protein YvlB
MTHFRTLGLAGVAALLLAVPAHAQRPVNARHDAASTGTVEIAIHSGSLRVTGWSRGEVQVTGSLSRSSDRVEVDGGGRTVEVRVASQRGGRAGGADLEVRVPAGSTLQVAVGSGRIVVNGITGSVEAESSSGPVTVQGNARSIEVMAQSGPVTIEGQTGTLDVTSLSGPVRVTANVRQRATIEALSGTVELLGSVGEAQVEAMSGNVRVANATGRVELEAVSGNVTVSGARLRGSVESVSGSLLVDGSVGGTLSLETHGGNVELRLPSGTNAEVNMETFSGGLRSDFGNGTGEGRRERHVTLGRGGPAVSITTFSGDVKLLRK